MISRYKDIIFLLGAGASAEAGIPTSGEMVNKIEALLREDSRWQEYGKLYNHIKSAIYYAAGLNGLFNQRVAYNIETLVNTLYELERNEQHPLYPFIASMNARFISLAGSDFENIKAFRGLILERLKQWMAPEDLSRRLYYNGFKCLQQNLNFPLHVFSLNYDLCVERLDCDDFRVEAGFDGFGPGSCWDWERFEEGDTGPEPPQIYLYKLHGSINWKRDNSKNLYRVEDTASIDANQMELIFGRDFKVEAADPYLFYLYAFRAASLCARVIVLLGYGFADGHINDMLAQALRSDCERRLMVVGSCADESSKEDLKTTIRESLNVRDEQFQVETNGAKAFLEMDGLGDLLQSMIPTSPEAPF